MRDRTITVELAVTELVFLVGLLVLIAIGVHRIADTLERAHPAQEESR